MKFTLLLACVAAIKIRNGSGGGNGQGSPSAEDIFVLCDPGEKLSRDEFITCCEDNSDVCDDNTLDGIERCYFKSRNTEKLQLWLDYPWEYK